MQQRWFKVDTVVTDAVTVELRTGDVHRSGVVKNRVVAQAPGATTPASP